jgi:cyclophilin family peptidyl-prolyl cis-trans isomerase
MNSNEGSMGIRRFGAGRCAVAGAVLLALLMTGCSERKSASSGNVVIETDLGTIKFELLVNEAPRTAENFRLLAERGYYDGTIFHRVIAGFMIQGGDPNGDGSGGESATGAPLPNEIDRNLPLYQGGYQRGLVAMANKGRPETGGSQFFIMHQRYPLPANYTIFGRVTEGMDVVDKIATAPNTGPSTMNRPVTPVKVNRVFIE